MTTEPSSSAAFLSGGTYSSNEGLRFAECEGRIGVIDTLPDTRESEPTAEGRVEISSRREEALAFYVEICEASGVSPELDDATFARLARLFVPGLSPQDLHAALVEDDTAA